MVLLLKVDGVDVLLEAVVGGEAPIAGVALEPLLVQVDVLDVDLEIVPLCEALSAGLAAVTLPEVDDPHVEAEGILACD